jgi:hypothetical protein
MSTNTASADFAFDYTRGAKPADASKVATPAKKGGRLMAFFTRLAASRERAAMAQIAMFDPRLAREIQIAKDRAEWELSIPK